MLSAGFKKNLWMVFGLLTIGCGSQSKSSGPGAEPSPAQSDNATATEMPADAWSTRRSFGVNWSWESPVKAETFVNAMFTVIPPAGQTLSSVSDLQIDPWMPSMGHGTATDDQEILPVAGSPGKFKIRGIYFIMGGPWEIKLTATVNGITDLASLKVQVE